MKKADVIREVLKDHPWPWTLTDDGIGLNLEDARGYLILCGRVCGEVAYTSRRIPELLQKLLVDVVAKQTKGEA
jgi:hypothetical protein